NRDWLLRPAPTPGLPARADPSARELETVLTEEPMPPERRPDEDDEGPPREAPRLLRARRLRLPDAALDLGVVAFQLRFVQFVVAAAAGSLTGAILGGPPGALLGLVLGCVVAGLRQSWLGALAGAVAGGLCAHVPGGLIGFVLGLCMGDWRQSR